MLHDLTKHGGELGVVKRIGREQRVMRRGVIQGRIGSAGVRK